MIKAREWPVRAMYILIAAALALSLFITAAPAPKVSAANNTVKAEWDRASTPTSEDWVLAPQTIIVDYAVAEEGDVAYAIVDGPNCKENATGTWLLKSTDDAATWTDITKGVKKEISKVLDLDSEDDVTMEMFTLLKVATDGVDADFVAVALDISTPGDVHVFVSTDGGDTFKDTGTIDMPARGINDFAVSLPVDDTRDIAIGGTDWSKAVLFRCEVTTTGTISLEWKDATAYDGWNDDDEFGSLAVADIQFSPSWEEDMSVLVTTYTGIDSAENISLQTGTWVADEDDGGWNSDSIASIDAVLVNDELGPIDISADLDHLVAGITLPSDYSAETASTRYAWVWVNYQSGSTPAAKIFLVTDDSSVSLMQQVANGRVWLTDVSYWGTIASGKAIASALGDGKGGLADCCTGVQVYRHGNVQNMALCCVGWDSACQTKLPTGRYAMAVFYVRVDKAYAVAVGENLQEPTDYDESAWSVSFDDGNIWNQISLVDTFIHYFSDVAVSPDCNKMILVSINSGLERVCGCDSVWLYAKEFPRAAGEEGYSDDYSGHWLRTWCGNLEYDWGMLRLAPEELAGADVKTVYLVDGDTSTIYYNDLETLGCWVEETAKVDEIEDLAVANATTIYALDRDGGVTMSDEHGARVSWTDPVDSKVDAGNTIAVHGDYVLVGGRDGDVSYSDDGGETFALLEEETPTIDGYVTVAFDSYFHDNDIIYAATEYNPEDDIYTGGIYRWAIGTSDSWTDLKANPTESQLGLPLDTVGGNTTDDTVQVAFTGLVVDRPGNPFTSNTTGGVIYASYYYWDGETGATGVARSLDHEITTCTSCINWDYLHVGLNDEEGFEATPHAVKICGCLSPTTDSKLYAIDDWNDYDMCENEAGSVWTFDDCYGKQAPKVTTPVVKADPCTCYSAPFTLTWETLCDACYYEIEFALDADFTMPVYVNGDTLLIHETKGDTPSYSIMGGEAGGLSCDTTYYWRVRASEAATGQVIHSWWSDGSFSVPPSLLSAKITLLAPVGDDVPRTNVGFSWSLQTEANKFVWTLSKSPTLSSPIGGSQTVTTTACQYSGTLDYDTTYYWQVLAYKDTILVSRSDIGTFRTVVQTPTPTPTKEVTPTWVWVVIAIGAVLVIVVIVLIFRTRRV